MVSSSVPLKASGGTCGAVSQNPFRVACAQIHLCCEAVNSARDKITSIPVVDAKGADAGLSAPGLPTRSAV